MGMLLHLAPIAFILLWSTGFIGARLGLPYVEPFTFLTVRFAAVIVALLAIIAIWRAFGGVRPWPTPRQSMHAAVVGAAIHGCYLGGVFWAIGQGMPAGVAALVVCLQPLLTAALAGPLLGEKVAWKQWLGLALGLAGAVAVLSPALLGSVIQTGSDGQLGSSGTVMPEHGAATMSSQVEALTGAPVIAVILALLAITGATLYQKRYCGEIDLLTGGVFQYLAAVGVTGVLAVSLETGEIRWTGELVFAMAWLVLVLSIGAVFLLMYLIQHADASRVAALFYMVPPATALQAWLLFDERLAPIQIVGTLTVMAGLYFAAARTAAPPVVSPPASTGSSNRGSR
ncbi:MAG: DMT family transporter [Pseudomonadota bacterium]